MERLIGIIEAEIAIHSDLPYDGIDYETKVRLRTLRWVLRQAKASIEISKSSNNE